MGPGIPTGTEVVARGELGVVDVAGLLLELYGRIPPLIREAVDGLDAAQLTRQPALRGNTIGWLIWHMSRVQDDHVAEILDLPQIWVGADHAIRFGLTADPTNTGWGHTIDEMLAVRPDGPGSLLDYFDAVDRRTRGMLEGLRRTDLDRIVDRRWDPPVTLGVRLISIADDSLQHVGQALYLRGILDT